MQLRKNRPRHIQIFYIMRIFFATIIYFLHKECRSLHKECHSIPKEEISNDSLTLRKTCRNLAYWFKFVFNGYLPLRPTAWFVKA